MILLALIFFLNVSTPFDDRALPPFDPGRAVFDPRDGTWCDPNWCLFDPGGVNGWIYSSGKCAEPCGYARWDAEDPDVRAYAYNPSYQDPAGLWLAMPAILGGVPPWRIPNPDNPERTGGPGGGGGGNPGGGNPGHPGTPGGSADACPAPEAIRFDPVWTVRAWPPHPLVVGQDPRREGIRYEIEVRIPPVLYRRYEKEPDVCVPVPDADGDGKPDREGSCTTASGWPGDLQPGACRLVEERYPEPVAGEGTLRMTLRSSSREWILGELAARYPGATVRMPEILLRVPGQGEILGDKTFVLRAVANPKPADPGYYDVLLAFDTAGTPVSAPRRILWQTPADRPQPVYLLEVTIVK